MPPLSPRNRHQPPRDEKQEDTMIRKIIGWYVVSPTGQQIEWHRDRRKAREACFAFSKIMSGVFYLQPEYEA